MRPCRGSHIKSKAAHLLGSVPSSKKSHMNNFFFAHKSALLLLFTGGQEYYIVAAWHWSNWRFIHFSFGTILVFYKFFLFGFLRVCQCSHVSSAVGKLSFVRQIEPISVSAALSHFLGVTVHNLKAAAASGISDINILTAPQSNAFEHTCYTLNRLFDFHPQARLDVVFFYPQVLTFAVITCDEAPER